MTKTTMIRINKTGKFYEFISELFGRTYYKDGEELKSISNNEVSWYTKKEYQIMLKAMSER